MEKLRSLRDHLTSACPQLQQAPEQLSVFVERGRLVCAGGSSISFEYAFTVKLVILDFAGHADAIMVPLLAWIKRNQSDILEHPERRGTAIRFEAELLSQEAVDLSIEVDLTEAVVVKPGAAPSDLTTAGRYNITHRQEPGFVGLVDEPQQWDAVIGDQVLASWSFEPPQD
jgi:hypothetical protein